MVAQIIWKFPELYGIQHSAFYSEESATGPFISQINAVHILQFYFFMSILILSFRVPQVFLSRLFLSGF
jgi:hypothetical protein